MDNEEIQGVNFSQFPSETPGNADEVVGLHSGGNVRFTIANIVAAVRNGLANIFVPKTDVGAAGGVAGLDSTGKVPSTQLPPISSDAADISYDNTGSGLSATDVQEAIDELAQGTGGGTAASVSYDPTTSGASATNVQDALDEAFDDLDGKQAEITASGILKGDGQGGVSAATAGTDYQAPLTAGTDYATPAQLADKANQSQLAYVETGTTATKTGGYNAGEYICWQGTLYTANINIAYGTTLSAGTGGNLTQRVAGGFNDILLVDIPYSSFEWFTGIPAFRAAYATPTGYDVAAINVYCTNGNAAFEPRYSGGYVWVAGITNRGVSIDQSYVIVCTVMLRKL